MARTFSIFVSTNIKTVALKVVCFTPLNRKVTTIIDILIPRTVLLITTRSLSQIRISIQSIIQEKRFLNGLWSLRRFLTNHIATISGTDRKCGVFKENKSTLWRLDW